LEIDPNSALVHLRLGLFHRSLGETREAIAAFEKCLALYPEEPTAIANLEELKANAK
jgi:tetratricopeptide (TPR) repeat protein